MQPGQHRSNQVVDKQHGETRIRCTRHGCKALCHGTEQRQQLGITGTVDRWRSQRDPLNPLRLCGKHLLALALAGGVMRERGFPRGKGGQRQQPGRYVL